MITVEVHFFATIRAVIGKKTLTVKLPEGATVKDVKQEIARRYPQAEQVLGGMLAAVDHDFSGDQSPVGEGAEIAFFPHVGGG
jgi:molybdopterin synthase sulfur carrier subunit